MKALQPWNCKCRNCGKLYNEDKATADWKGYCSQACVHEKAYQLGYRPRNKKLGIGFSEYAILSRANVIGSVFVDNQGCVV